MKKTLLLSLLVSLFAVVACGKNNTSGKSKPPSTLNPVTGTLPDMTGTADQLIHNINERRAISGLRPLARDTSLDGFAQSDAQDLADGRQGFRRYNMCRTLPRSIGGRVCRTLAHIGTRPNVDFVFRDWLREDEARDMLSNRLIERAGVGFSINRRGEQVWVVMMTGN